MFQAYPCIGFSPWVGGCPYNAAFTRPDNDTTDTNKMSCMELCGSVHTIQRQIPAQIPIDSIPILSVSVSVSASVIVNVNTP